VIQVVPIPARAVIENQGSTVQWERTRDRMYHDSRFCFSIEREQARNKALFNHGYCLQREDSRTNGKMPADTFFQ
jgi:hypothetical protein